MRREVYFGVVLLVGCGKAVPTPSSSRTPVSQVATSVVASSSSGAQAKIPAPAVFADPFEPHSWPSKCEERQFDRGCRNVILLNVPPEQMKLVGLVQNGDEVSALIEDDCDLGYVVKVGDYIGKAEPVDKNGTVNWKVRTVSHAGVELALETMEGDTVRTFELSLAQERSIAAELVDAQ